MRENQRAVAIPPWVDQLDMAIWITGPDRRIRYFNERVESLLGISASEAVGALCYNVIGGREPSGESFCGPGCALFRATALRRPIGPMRLRLQGPLLSNSWIHVLPLAVGTGPTDFPLLIHCGFNCGGYHRDREYLSKVLARTARKDQVGQDSGLELTKRELEIIHLLSEDHNLRTISTKLGISYVTVRNHIQNILRKLNVHSKMEAIATYLLKGQ